MVDHKTRICSSVLRSSFTADWSAIPASLLVPWVPPQSMGLHDSQQHTCSCGKDEAKGDSPGKYLAPPHKSVLVHEYGWIKCAEIKNRLFKLVLKLLSVYFKTLIFK